MVEFQFYRPQANALEQLWSQYAQARGQQGGAFERGFVPGMMAGFEGLAKKQASKAETEARAAERKEDRDFQRTLIDEKTAADQRERDKLAANDLAEATAIFSANGENPHDAYLRGQQAKTRQNALAIIDTEKGVKQQKDKEAAAAAEAARLNSERSEAGGLFTALQGDKLTDPIAIQGAMDLVNSADEKLILEGKDKLRTLAQESRQRGALMTDIDELLGVGDLTTAARQGKTLVQPGKEDEFTEARNVLIGAKQVLATPQLWQAKSPAERQVVVKSAEEASIKIRTLTSPNPYQDPRLRDEYSKQGLRNWLQLGDAKAPVVFYNGQVAGVTPEDKSSLDLWISKQISNDPILRNVLRDQGVDQNLVQTALAAGNTAGITQLLGNTTPSGADVRTLIEEARTRITKDTLRSMGVRIVDPQIPEGVNVIQALQPTQQAEVARIVQAFANDVRRTQGREPTNQEFADHMMSKGYYDLEFVAQGVVPKQAAQAAAPGTPNTPATPATPAAGATAPAGKQAASAGKPKQFAVETATEAEWEKEMTARVTADQKAKAEKEKESTLKFMRNEPEAAVPAIAERANMSSAKVSHVLGTLGLTPLSAKEKSAIDKKNEIDAARKNLPKAGPLTSQERAAGIEESNAKQKSEALVKEYLDLQSRSDKLSKAESTRLADIGKQVSTALASKKTNPFTKPITKDDLKAVATAMRDVRAEVLARAQSMTRVRDYTPLNWMGDAALKPGQPITPALDALQRLAKSQPAAPQPRLSAPYQRPMPNAPQTPDVINVPYGGMPAPVPPGATINVPFGGFNQNVVRMRPNMNPTWRAK